MNATTPVCPCCGQAARTPRSATSMRSSPTSGGVNNLPGMDRPACASVHIAALASTSLGVRLTPHVRLASKP